MASDGSPSDDFGEAVALDGDTALLLACGAEGGTSGYIYTRSDDIWSEQAKLTPHPVPACGGPFDIFKGNVALDGDTAMVATWYPFDIDETPQAGALAIYARTGEQWVEQVVFEADEGEIMGAGDSALDGDTALVLSGTIDPPVAVISVFARTDGQWTERAPIVPPEGVAFTSSFPGVALDGDTALVVGEYAEQPDQKIVLVFVRDGDEWTLQAQLTPSDGAEDLHFGWSVAIDGETALVGASRTEVGVLGKVYVYTREGETWSEQAQLTAPIDGDEDGNFGRALALDGDTALVGARGLDTVFVFSRAGVTWSAIDTLTPVDDAPFAYRVALDGDTAIVGVNPAGFGIPPDFDPNIPGWAYAFDTRPPAPTIRLDPSLLIFGAVPVGQHSLLDFPVTVENNGSAGLVIGALTFDGEHPDDFELVEDSCSGQVIDPGDTCSVELRFAPTGIGDREASLDVPSNAPTGLASVALIGEGLEGPPTIRWDPDNLHAVMTSGDASGEALTLTNLGTFDLEWGVISGGGLGLAEPLRPRHPATVFDTVAPLTRVDRSSRLATAYGDPRVLHPHPSGDQEIVSETVSLTHSQSTEIVVPNTPKCVWSHGPFTTPNQFLRTFTLPDFGIRGDFDVTEVAFGVESLNAQVDITVNLYTLDGALLVYDNLTLLASETVTLSPQEGTIATVPLSATVPAGATLVMEVAAPDMNEIGQFAAGSNSAGEFAPSYLATRDCGGIFTPVTFESLGSPGVHLVMSVTGTLDCDLPNWLTVAPTSGIVAGGASAPVTVTLDSSGLPLGEFGANLCLATNDPAKPFVFVPASLSVVDEVIPPVADISPASIEFMIGQPTGSDTQTLTIGNLGNADSLDWDLLTAGAGGEGCYDRAEVPWLTVAPMSGSVTPGDSQAVAVTASGVLHENGPLINRPDAGPGGADLSVLESLTLGMDTPGWVVVDKGGFRVADDFEVAEEWQVDALTFFVYQFGSPPASTIDRVNYQIWDGPPDNPESSVIFGDTLTNRLRSTEWAGAYRVDEPDSFNTRRPIMRVMAEGGFTLPPGRYWVDVQFGDDGTILGPPYQPPVAILGEIATGNAMYLDHLGWGPMVDLGTGAPQGMPFMIHGLTSLSEGTYETTLCISSNDPESPQVNVPVTLTVTGADLSFDSLSLDFGDIPVGSISPPQTALLQNVGEVDVTGLSFDPPADDFVVDTTACGDALPVGQSCAIELAFAPSEAGLVEAMLEVSSDEGGTGALSLSARGVPISPNMDLAPASFDVTLETGEITTESLSISNLGPEALDWEITQDGGTSRRILRPSRPTIVPSTRDTAGAVNSLTGPRRAEGEEGMAQYPFPTPASGEVAITHSESLDILTPNTPTCDNGTTFANSFLRTFTLGDFGITGDFDITEVTFGVETLNTTVPIAVNLYTLEGELIFDNLTPIGTATQELTSQDLTLVNVPVTGTAPVGSTLVVEIRAPDLTGVGRFTPGSNDLGETAPSYIAVDPTDFRCVPMSEREPVPYAAIGYFDVHLVMTVTGNTPLPDCTLPDWASALPMSGSVPWGENQAVDVTFDATGLTPGDFTANLCLASNDPMQPLTVVPLTLTVTPPPVALAFDPANLELGDVEVGDTSATLSATLHNDGVAAATGLTFDLGDGAFAVDAGNCGESLPPGASCTVSVTFSPVDAGPAAATLQAASATGASAELGLTGNGVDAGVVTPTALEVDPEVQISDGNGVFEPGELVIAAPWWRNDGLLPKSLTGTTSDLFGPEGVPHSVEEGSADYGTLQPGESGSCLDTDSCYLLLVGDPTARPMTHWDATFDETLDDAVNTGKTWTVHIGGSFADVPKSSLFYASIETLLHRGITGGCTASEYCPGGVNSRSLMPVFMLRALEGPDYTPPACDTGEERLFSDVPADHLFCPWIEELHRRELISGCGGGAYCPRAPVTRAQMAVFLLRALEGADYGPPECSGQFADVPCPSLFADWIEELATREITSGCTETRYCASDPVTRAQMAVFITSTFGLTLYGP